MCPCHCSQIFFKFLLRDGLLPKSWEKTKITPIHQKAEQFLPQNLRLIAINGCVYKLYAKVVRPTDCTGVGQESDL